MNVEELRSASQTLTWVSQRLLALPEDRADAVTASLLCSAAQRVVLGLAVSLNQGVEPYEALRMAAIDDLPVDPSRTELLKTLAARTRPTRRARFAQRLQSLIHRFALSRKGSAEAPSK